jgi:hypothetical protein
MVSLFCVEVWLLAHPINSATQKVATLVKKIIFPDLISLLSVS